MGLGGKTFSLVFFLSYFLSSTKQWKTTFSTLFSSLFFILSVFTPTKHTLIENCVKNLGLCLVHLLKHMFSVFKQHYTFLYTFSPTHISTYVFKYMFSVFKCIYQTPSRFFYPSFFVLYGSTSFSFYLSSTRTCTHHWEYMTLICTWFTPREVAWWLGSVNQMCGP